MQHTPTSKEHTMSANNTAALLSQMLNASRGSGPAQGEDDGNDIRLLAQPAHLRVARRIANDQTPTPAPAPAPVISGQTEPPNFNPDWARENPAYCTGRGPTGRLRNFRAMNDGKLLSTLASVRRETNDWEALNTLLGEAQSRGL
jgi:hypothetical protein